MLSRFFVYTNLIFQDGAKCVYIFEQDVLQQALEKLTLEIQESKSLDVGNNQMVAFVCLKAPPCGQYSMLHQKKIFGDYKLTSLDALESARLATLLYLQEMGIIFVDDINLSEVTKYEIKLAECQQKLLAASNFTNMFQQEIESLKTKLDSAYQENQKLAVATKALIPPAKDVKKEESTSETFNTTKQVCTPPSIDHRSNHRLLQHRKRSSSHDANVKRTILKTLSTADSKPQSSNSGNASHSTDSVEYGTN